MMSLPVRTDSSDLLDKLSLSQTCNEAVRSGINQVVTSTSQVSLLEQSKGSRDDSCHEDSAHKT